MSDVNAIINWLLTKPTTLQKDWAPKDYFTFIGKFFERYKDAMGYSTDMQFAESGELQMPAVLYQTGEYSISVILELSTDLNRISSAYFEGAGEITKDTGCQSLLLLIALQNEFQKKWQTKESLILFCNRQGKSLEFSDFQSCKDLLSEMGFDVEYARKQAVILGLAQEPINWDSIVSDVDQAFF